MASDQFKAEAGVEYLDKATGKTISFTSEQLQDPASGVLMTDRYSAKTTEPAPATPPPAAPVPDPAPAPAPTPAPEPAQPAPAEEQAAAQEQPVQEQEQPPTQQYRIMSGDNLTKIAQKYGLTVNDLLLANPQISNPNMIYAGQNLTIPSYTGSPDGFSVPEGYERISGAEFPTTELQRANFSDIRTDPTNTFLYGRRIDPAGALNDQARDAYDLLNSADELASDKITRKSEKEKTIQEEIENILGLNKNGDADAGTIKTSDGSVIDLSKDKSALDMYNELLRSDTIKDLSTRAGDIQQQLDELAASEVALRNDIAKQVEGEAPQSYIDAKVAEKMKDLYPKKLALQAELRNVVGQLQGEKENAANILQFTLQDEETRYNRMFDYLQFQTQQGQVDFSNRLELFKTIKDLPPDRSITIDGVEYKGVNEDANLSVIQFTDENRNITVTAVDKRTGEIKYSQVIGKAPAGKSGSGSGEISLTKQYSEMVAGQNINILEGVQSGQYQYVPTDDGDVLVDTNSYANALQEWNTGGSWWQNDESVSVTVPNPETGQLENQTFVGPKGSMPDPLSYEVIRPSDLK